MSDRKRKLEDIVLDLKSGSGKKLKSGQTTTTENSNMAANHGNSASGSNMDSMDSGELCLRTLMLNISRDLNESINGINQRIMQVEENLEKNLVEKLTNVIHLTVKDEISKSRSDFDSEICAIKLKLSDMEKVLQGPNGTLNVGDAAQMPCAVIIRNLKGVQTRPKVRIPLLRTKLSPL